MAVTRRTEDQPVLVCGLGRFGAATADALSRLGHEVLVLERDPHRVEEWATRLPRVVEADSSNADALAELGVAEFEFAVVAIGTSVESSVLTALNLVDLGVGQIWAKALSTSHGTILQRIGVHRVIYPEVESGRRVAHLLNGRLLDYMEFDDGFAIVKMRPPKETQGFTLGQTAVRSRYGVTVVGVKSPGKDFTYATPQTRVSEHDLLIVSGHTGLIDRFAARP